jgi:hypothetical protein
MDSTKLDHWEPDPTFWEQHPDVYAICKTEWGAMLECFYPYFYPMPNMPQFWLDRSLEHGYYEVQGGKWKTCLTSIYPDSVPWDDSLRINPKGDPYVVYRRAVTSQGGAKMTDGHCKCFVVEECGCGKPGDGTVDLSGSERGTLPARLLTVDELCVVESFAFDGEAWLPVALEERENP